MSDFRKPQLSYVTLPGGLVTVTCTCGWKDPMGPVRPGPFDPGEALMAALAEHPFCTKYVDPKNITGATTLTELREQRELLGLSALMVFPNTDNCMAIAQHPVAGTCLATGATEADAIEAAFVKVRKALLPAPLREMLDTPAPEKP